MSTALQVSVAAPPKQAPYYRPTWAEVDLGRVRSNLKELRRRIGRGVKVLFVVKANGYGHGAVEMARLAEAEGAEWLGVSSVEEGLSLRQAGVRLPALILGSLYPFDSFRIAARSRLTPTVASPEAARILVESARRHGLVVDCHLKLDTGMGRIGMSRRAALEALRMLSGSGLARATGIYTHLACADSDPAYTREQLKSFAGTVREAERLGYSVPLRHAANSVGALRHPAARWDMVRPGLALYGLLDPFKPAMSLKTQVVFVKRVPKGTRLGYGSTFRTRRPSRIATLPVGYADGLPRSLSNRGHVLMGGRRCRIAGAISMDMMMADVTDLKSCHVGDTAVLIGEQGKERLTATELARLAGTIPYEIVTGVSARVPRVYVG